MSEKPITHAQLTDEQLEQLVERVTERVIENFYLSVGRNVVKRFFWIVGLATVSLLGILAGTGHLNK